MIPLKSYIAQFGTTASIHTRESGDRVRIDQLEDIINRCKRDCPVLSGVLPSELRRLAELYGAMIYDGRSSVAVDEVADDTRRLLARWAPQSPSGPP